MKNSLNRNDFSVLADASGYQIQYKGQNIGGAGTLRKSKLRGRSAWVQRASYLEMAEYDINTLILGYGRNDMRKCILRINKNEKFSLQKST